MSDTIIRILCHHLDIADAKIADLQAENQRLREQLTDACHAVHHAEHEPSQDELDKFWLKAKRIFNWRHID